MNITRDTKLLDLMDQYPWLMDEAKKLSPDIEKITSPLGRMFLKKATIADVSKRVGIPEDEIIDWVEKLLISHEQND